MSEPFIAEIIMFGGNFAPRGWALCDGQLLSISSNSALFSLLGTTYGGDGRTTFGLPDLRGRVAIHPGTGPGLSTYRLGQKAGAENVTLNLNQIPSHTHQAKAHAGPGNRNTATGSAWSDDAGVSWAAYTNTAPTANMHTGAIANAGGSQSHTNIQPYLCVNFIIALVGVFPSRN